MIHAEAVEAAARVLYESGTKERFADADPEDVAHMTVWAQEALEAAAPYMGSRSAWHDAVSEAYVEGALSGEQANVMWSKNPYAREKK